MTQFQVGEHKRVPSKFINEHGLELDVLTFVWSSFDAAKTIACDFMPRIATGFRLQRTHTFQFCSFITTDIFKINDAWHQEHNI
jgi:hypothetical protein